MYPLGLGGTIRTLCTRSCPPGGMKPCRRRRNQYWPRAILVSSHLTYAILVVEHNSMLSSFCQPQKTSCFPDNLQLSYYSCRHLAPFSHTTFCSFSVHCNYNVPIFSCTVYKLIRVGTAVCIYDISRKEDKDGDWWFSINHGKLQWD